MRMQLHSVVVVVSALVLAAGPAWGSEHQPECGEVLTESVVLTEDMHCTSGFALVIGASGVTVDLAGHTISGSGIVALAGGQTLHDVAVRGGTIRDFTGLAVFLGQTVGATLHDLRVLDGGTGFAVEAGQDTTISSSHFEGTPVAVSLFFGGAATVRASTFVGNRIGVLVEDFGDHVVEHNRFVGNERGVLLTDSDAPGAARDSRVTRNRFEGNEIGLELRAELSTTGNEISGNRFAGNRGSGMLVTARAGLGGAAGTVVAGNRFDRNGFDPPEITRTLGDGTDPGTVTFLADDGLTVVTGAPPEAAGISVRRNRAFFNADLGIDAPGVTDGGGNHGRRNGNPLECVGVDCRPGRRP